MVIIWMIHWYTTHLPFNTIYQQYKKNVTQNFNHNFHKSQKFYSRGKNKHDACMPNRSYNKIKCKLNQQSSVLITITATNSLKI